MSSSYFYGTAFEAYNSDLRCKIGLDVLAQTLSCTSGCNQPPHLRASRMQLLTSYGARNGGAFAMCHLRAALLSYAS